MEGTEPGGVAGDRVVTEPEEVEAPAVPPEQDSAEDVAEQVKKEGAKAPVTEDQKRDDEFQVVYAPYSMAASSRARTRIASESRSSVIRVEAVKAIVTAAWPPGACAETPSPTLQSRIPSVWQST